MAQPARARLASATFLRPENSNRSMADVIALPSLGTFGIAGTQVSRMVRPAANLGEVAEDFRRRLRDFIDDERRGTRLAEFISYLRDRALGLETRRDYAGRDTNYLIDLKSRKEVAASTVDPRLSVAGIKRMFGVTPTEVADRKAEEMTPEQKRAMQIRRLAAPHLLTRSGRPSFDNWDDMRFCAPRVLGGDFTARGNDLWIGKEVGVASEDPQENLRIIQRLRKEGVEVIAPARTPMDLKAGRLIPGMLLLDAKTATRSTKVTNALSLPTLSKSFGGDLFSYFERMNAEFSKTRRASASMDAGDFLRQYTRPRRRPAPEVPISSACTIRQEIVDGKEAFKTVHPDRTLSAFNFHKLAPGRYRKEDDFGMPCGLIDVFQNGYTHLDNAGRPHNETGPATVRYEGGVKTEAFALSGVEIRKDELYAPRPLPVPTPKPVPSLSERRRQPNPAMAM